MSTNSNRCPITKNRFTQFGVDPIGHRPAAVKSFRSSRADAGASELIGGGQSGSRKKVKRLGARALRGASRHLTREEFDDEGHDPQYDRNVREIEIGNGVGRDRTEMQEVEA